MGKTFEVFPLEMGVVENGDDLSSPVAVFGRTWGSGRAHMHEAYDMEYLLDACLAIYVGLVPRSPLSNNTFSESPSRRKKRVRNSLFHVCAAAGRGCLQAQRDSLTPATRRTRGRSVGEHT